MRSNSNVNRNVNLNLDARFIRNLINSTLELGSWETTLFRRYPATLTILFKFCVLNTNKVYLQIKY